jgi:radical SAM protein with 4Fe4S-binding SPASM domain
MKRKKGHMDIHSFKHIIDLNPELDRVYLTNWGEPLIHPQINQMIAYAHAQGKQTAVTTNGTTLDKSFSREILKSGLDIIKFSVDGNKETYQKIRGFSFEKIESNISEFIKTKIELKKKTWVEVSMLVYDENIAEMDAFLKKWKTRADFVNFQPKFFSIQNKKFKPCRDLWRILVVLWDGRVVPCCVDYEGELVVGDAKKENLQDIFRGPNMRGLRRQHLNKELDGLCSRCSPYFADYHISKRRLSR